MTTKKSVLFAIFIALGIVLQILESFLPTTFLVPGFKIGFANIITLTVLMMYGQRAMWIVNSLRIILAALLTGTLFSISFWVSLAGFICAGLMMCLAKKTGLFSIYGISVAGAAAHSVGQVGAITWIYQQYFMQLYAPLLVGLSIFSGMLVALLAANVMKRIEGRIVLNG